MIKIDFNKQADISIEFGNQSDTLLLHNLNVEYKLFSKLFDDNIEQYIQSLTYGDLEMLQELIKDKKEEL